MPTVAPTYSELLEFAQNAVRDKTGLTNFSESSIIGTILNVNASYAADIWNALLMIESQSGLSTAAGVYLDSKGENFGIRRLQSSAATTIGAGQSVVFTNNSDTEDILVPGHTRIWSPKNSLIAYYTLAPITVLKGKSAYVDVAAAAPGADYNVGAETLTSHNVDNSRLTVTNVLPISNGTSVESDDNYRYRIALAMLAKSGSNEAAIELRMLEVPGVKSVVIQECVRGTGTVDVIVVPTARTVTQELLDQCQSALSEVVAFGISGIAKAPIERPIDLVIRVTIATAADPASVRALVSSAARSYIDNLAIGDNSGSGDFIFYELISRMKNVSTDVVDVAVQMKAGNRPALNVNQKAAPGERFFLQSIKVV